MKQRRLKQEDPMQGRVSKLEKQMRKIGKRAKPTPVWPPVSTFGSSYIQ